jgi:microcystin synthetase protein McyA
VRRSMVDRLPAYLLPSVYVRLDRLPLTASGKLDRRALPAPNEPREDTVDDSSYVEPRTDLERRLAEIWADVLGLAEPVGANDNFFGLGGDSIRTLQVRSKLERHGYTFDLYDIFGEPTVAGLATLLRPVKAAASPPPAPFGLLREADRIRLPDGLDDAYPVTRLQLAMIYHSEFGDTSTIFHDLESLHLEGEIDVDAVHGVLAELIAEHPILRTSFDLRRYEEPLQLAHTGVDVPLEVVDLAGLARAERERVLDEWFEQEKRRRFAWDSPPLARFFLHLTGPASAVFSMSCHHAILDGWSLMSLLGDVFSRTEPGYERGGPLQSAFSEYVALERAACESEESTRFWTGYLEGLTVGQLPGESAACAMPGAEDGVRSATELLPEQLSRRLVEIAEHLGVPLRTVLLAGHLRTVSLLSGSVEPVTGLITHGRPETSDADRVLGVFLNTLPLRVPVRQPSWHRLIQEVAAAEQQVHPHRRYPITEITKLNGGQLPYQFVFNFSRYDQLQRLVEEPGTVRLARMRSFLESDCPLLVTFNALGSDNRLRLTVTQRLGDGQADHVAVVMDYLRSCLRALATAPHGRPSARQVMPADELARLVELGTGTGAGTDPGGATTLPEIIAGQARRAPAAVAATVAGASMTYRELDAGGDELAGRLRALGVGPDSVVGLLVPRTGAMLVAMLGIWKAGGAYLPFDASSPAARIAAALRECRAAAVVTTQDYARLLPPDRPATVLLDGPAPVADPEPAPPVDAGTAVADNLAYVVHTSSSTGPAKAVGITHRGAVAFIRWAQRVYSPEELAVVPATTSLLFDCCLLEIIVPLATGGTVVLLDDVAGLGEPEAKSATIAGLVPSALAALLEQGSLPPSLRTLNLHGEVLTEQLRRQVLATTSVTRLLNCYGPSETTTYSTYSDVTLQDETAAVPIGRPVDNTRVYVLDERMEPVPVGVAGQLFIGGVGLARGYLGRPGLTAAAFVPDPFGGGGRLYATGDLARWRSDGVLEFLGRRDLQVKVRGYRVELAEVEAGLRAAPGVREAVVAAHGEGAQRRLVAYLVAGGGGELDVAAVRRSMVDRLPAYLLPSVYVRLDRLPLTASGKLDRRALPGPEAAADQRAETSYVAPRTDLERRLAAIWVETTGRPTVGVNDNFFALGGDSLQALRIVAQISEQSGVDLPIRALFENPTVAGLAEVCARLIEVSGSTRSATAPAATPPVADPYLLIETRPLLSLFALGELPRVDAAALCVIPGELLARAGMDSRHVQEALFQGVPVPSSVYQTPHGGLALITLPRFDFQVYGDHQDLTRMIGAGATMAAGLGARVVALTDLLGSATSHGTEVATGPVPVTTGHATTAAAVVAMVRQVLELTGRRLSNEDLGFLGLGAIGRAALRLLLTALPHPRSLVLCDVHEKRESVTALADEARRLGYQGPLDVQLAAGSVPDRFYESSLMVGATNVPHVMSVDRLRPGTLIVDDSGPHCFDPTAAVRRLEDRGDILFTRAGQVRAPQPIRQVRYLPPAWQALFGPLHRAPADHHAIEGCILSALLAATGVEVRATVGEVTVDDCQASLRVLGELGYRPGRLECGGYVIADEQVARFAETYGDRGQSTSIMEGEPVD